MPALRHPRKLPNGPDLDSADDCWWNARRDRLRFIKIRHVDEEVPTELFVRFRERTDGDQRLAFANSDTHRRIDVLQWRCRNELPSLASSWHRAMEASRNLSRSSVSQIFSLQ